MAKHIEKDWEKLSKWFGVHIPWYDTTRYQITQEQNMLRIFRQLNNEIHMEDLKDNLEAIDRSDIIELIEKAERDSKS